MELVNQPGSEEGAVESASCFGYEALGTKLRVDFSQRVPEIHPAIAGKKVGNLLTTQVGKVWQGRSAADEDQQACLCIALVSPCDPAPSVHHCEPLRAPVGEEVRPQVVGRRTGVRKSERADIVSNERPTAFEDNCRVVTLLDGGRPLCQQLVDVRGPGRGPDV